MNLSDFKKNKKGQVRNYYIVLVAMFVFGFMGILGYFLLSEMATAYESTGYWTSTMEETANNFLFSLQILDYVIVLILVVMIIGVALTSYKLNAKPAFFIISIIMAPFLGFVSYFFNYLFAQLVGQDVFTATLLYFPNTIIICTNLHWVALLAFAVGSIALYAKKDTGDETSAIVR